MMILKVNNINRLGTYILLIIIKLCFYSFPSYTMLLHKMYALELNRGRHGGRGGKAGVATGSHIVHLHNTFQVSQDTMSQNPVSKNKGK